MSDATALGDAAPTWSTVAAGYDVTPPKAKYAIINQERLFIANDPSGVDNGKSTVYYTPALKQDYFYWATDYELVRPDDGDEITFLKNLLGTLTVGKTRTISKIYTEGAVSGWSVSDPFSFIGCTSPGSAVNGISGILYAGRYGIYNFGGQSSELVSDSVTDRIRDILETNQDEIVGAYHDNSYYMAYTSSQGGAANNDHVMVLDITRNAYVEDTEHIDSFATFDAGDDAGILYSGSSEIDGSVYAAGASYSKVTYRYKSQIDTGTSTNTHTGGEETTPTITLGNNGTWAGLGAGQWNASGSWTWLLHSQTGDWTSPVIQVNASSFDKLAWNESLSISGDVTFQIRSGDTLGEISAATWSSAVTDPSGSDISGVTAKKYVQIKANLSTSSWSETPTLYVENSYMIKMMYKKSGDAVEPAYLSLWTGGKNNLGIENPKQIKEIQVFYEGTAGTLNVAYASEDGVARSFNIDLSKSPATSAKDAYFGTVSDKVFVYIPDFQDQPVGRNWQFTVSDTGTEQWKIKRIVVRVSPLPYNTFQGEI
jgi:hypothetical protein